MRYSRFTVTSCLVGALAGALAAVPARAEPARDLMGRVPSVAELVEALHAPSQPVVRGLVPGGELPSRPAVDLEVRFEFNSATLTPMARAVLDNLGTALTTDLASDRFMIEGHTDAVGSDSYNLSLSERRARAVWGYLHDVYQVESARMTAVGKGEQELLLPDQPDAAPNRRVRVINQG
jgi:outer membrane protein OmpA-like peptidoglycan-associated protein